MSLLGGSSRLQVDEAVKRVLVAYGQSEPADRPAVIRRLVVRLTDVQRMQLIARLAEVSVGQLWVLLQEKPQR